ncbi:MAG TPA: hypothetical protein VF251_14510 [Pyrinomonadaceae bacterium]
MSKKEELIRLLATCSPEDRIEIFQILRKEIPIHSLETELNTQAEVILEAMSRSADLTMRGIRGIIAEAAFLIEVLQKLEGWKIGNVVGNAAYDFLIEDSMSRVSIQVKMQRRQRGIPLIRKNKFVVETQKTRGGKDAAGEDTRPYRFGEFDILVVSLHPSTNDWTTFAYTVGRWLLPRSNAPHLLEVFQPIPQAPNDDWTDDLLTCIEWLRSGVQRTIGPF